MKERCDNCAKIKYLGMGDEGGVALLCGAFKKNPRIKYCSDINPSNSSCRYFKPSMKAKVIHYIKDKFTKRKGLL